MNKILRQTRLDNGKYLRLELRPDLGGAIGGLWLDNIPILRPTPAHAQSSRETACFPMIPYSGRLAWCRFNWDGANYTTQKNFAESPHSLHGVGWQRAWQMASQQESDTSRAYMNYVHDGDADWPFAFLAAQEFILDGNGLKIKLTLTNKDQRPQPVGLGFHPYFPRTDVSHIATRVKSRWDVDASLLPSREIAQTIVNDRVSAMNYDHCFGGWAGSVAIEQAGGLKFNLGATPANYLVIYTPQDKDYFCVEPVSHRTNALNDPDPDPDPSQHGLRILASGDEMTATMYFRFG
ncbi:MAG: aldose 1-epimerase [Alphaproteobacteria bacterium]|nr:aldose 1-epimerase [Alphaproteobacteria bacterium]